MNIPDDLREYLAAPENRSLATRGIGLGTVTLYAPDELPVRMFTIYKRNAFTHERYRGVDLVKACKSYDPQGIMVWFSALKVYGSWDCDHHQIVTFPGATWTDIVKSPSRYFGAQWNPDDVPHRYLRPRAAKKKRKS